MSRDRAKNPAKTSALASKGLLCLVVVLVAMSLCSRPGYAAAITPSQVSGADTAIQSSFASVYGAEKSGGNVSSLDARLNVAIQLVQQAEAENETNPAQAAADIENATSIAQSVAAESSSVSQEGALARQTTEITSLGAASGIVIVAALTYSFGGRMYRRVWLRLYKDYVVRPADG